MARCGLTPTEAQRLPTILKDSRRYQNEVSTALSEQVLAALHHLLRGFQAAHDATRGELLREVLRAEDLRSIEQLASVEDEVLLEGGTWRLAVRRARMALAGDAVPMAQYPALATTLRPNA